MLKTGEKAPDFRLQTDAAGEVSLGDLKGKASSALFLSQGGHTGLNSGSVRVS